MIDMSPWAIAQRLRHASACSDLRTERRLNPKLDMSQAGITRRLEQVEQLRRLCVGLGEIGASLRAGR